MSLLDAVIRFSNKRAKQKAIESGETCAPVEEKDSNSVEEVENLDELKELRAENKRLKVEVEQLRIQLSYKEKQMRGYINEALNEVKRLYNFLWCASMYRVDTYLPVNPDDKEGGDKNGSVS